MKSMDTDTSSVTSKETWGSWGNSSFWSNFPNTSENVAEKKEDEEVSEKKEERKEQTQAEEVKTKTDSPFMAHVKSLPKVKERRDFLPCECSPSKVDQCEGCDKYDEYLRDTPAYTVFGGCVCDDRSDVGDECDDEKEKPPTYCAYCAFRKSYRERFYPIRVQADNGCQAKLDAFHKRMEADVESQSQASSNESLSSSFLQNFVVPTPSMKSAPQPTETGTSSMAQSQGLLEEVQKLLAKTEETRLAIEKKEAELAEKERILREREAKADFDKRDGASRLSFHDSVRKVFAEEWMTCEEDWLSTLDKDKMKFMLQVLDIQEKEDRAAKATKCDQATMTVSETPKEEKKSKFVGDYKPTQTKLPPVHELTMNGNIRHEKPTNFKFGYADDKSSLKRTGHETGVPSNWTAWDQQADPF